MTHPYPEPPIGTDLPPFAPAGGRRRWALSLALALLIAATTMAFASSKASASTAYTIGNPPTGGNFFNSVDLLTKTPATPTSVGLQPMQVAIAPDDETAYVISASSTTGKVTPVDVATDAAAAAIEGPALAKAKDGLVSPDGKTLYVLTGTSVVPIDLESATIGTPIALPGASGLNESSGGIVITPDGSTIFAMRRLAMIEIDVATAGATTIAVSGSTSDLTISPDGATVYVPGGAFSAQVTPVDVATRTVGTPYAVPGGARAAAVSRDGEELYVAQATNFSTVDLSTGAVANVDVGSENQLNDIDVTPNGRVAWVASLRDNLLLIDLDTDTVQESIPLSFPSRRVAIAVSPADPNGAAEPTITTDVPNQGGTVGDPTNPTVTVDVAQLDEYGDPVPPVDLTVTATSSDQSVLPDDAVAVTGSGSRRVLSFDPIAMGNTDVTLNLTGAGGKSSTAQVGYLVSRATTPSSRVLQGLSDPSTAIYVGDDHMLVAEDEASAIFLYRTDVSGPPVETFDVGISANPTSGGEIDYESSVRVGDTIYWLGSHGNTKDGLPELSRHSVIATEVSGSGDTTTVTRSGAYGGLRRDLIEWDRANGDRLDLDNAQQGKPDDLDGFNIEGAELSPDDEEIYLGFRSPLSPGELGGKAVIVPVTNLDRVIAGRDEVAEFEDPILLDLGGMSIRELRRNASGQYVILAAFYQGSGTVQQALYSWTGERGDAPVLLSTVVPPSPEWFADAPGTWEGIGEIPDVLTEGGQIRLIMDQGFEEFYSDGGLKNKQSSNPRTRKSRTDVFTLEGNVGARITAPTPQFPAQATGTVGAGQWVTVTNSGSQKLDVDAVRVVAADDASAGDFLVGQEDCEGEVLGLGETCRVQVRFAPSRESATSEADLVLRGNVSGGESRVALTATSTTLPAGPSGEDGSDGQSGADGQDGANGQAGAAGPAGPKGDAGPAGPAGRDGVVSFAAKVSTASAKRGGAARLTFRVGNDTAAPLDGKVALFAPKGLKAGGKSTVAVKSIGAGGSRLVTVTVKVGRKAALGSHRVKVRFSAGGEALTRTVTVKVGR